MARPAALIAQQAPEWPLTARVRLIAMAAEAVPHACESCRSAPASFTIAWSDTQFQVCSACALPPAPASAAGEREPSSGKLAADRDHRPARPHHAISTASPARAGSVARPPARGLPCLPPAGKDDERDVLRAAARTLLTSRPSPRGRRLGRDGSCDVVAALVLAAGGLVDQTGRPVPPIERPAAQLLRRVLHRVADQLAGGNPGRSWNGDPIALIDAGQAHADLPGAARAAVLNAAVGHTSGRSSRSLTALDSIVAPHGSGSADKPDDGEPVPSPVAAAARPAAAAGVRS